MGDGGGGGQVVKLAFSSIEKTPKGTQKREGHPGKQWELSG
jgi:hypothetical protein